MKEIANREFTETSCIHPKKGKKKEKKRKANHIYRYFFIDQKQL